MKRTLNPFRFLLMSRVILNVGLVALIQSAYAEEKNWDVSALWKGDRSTFTEKGARHFESNEPMLRSVRVSKIVLAAGETCETAISKIRSVPIGESFTFGKPERFRGWDGWDDDSDAVEKCRGFPCKIKFNEPESLAIAAKPPEARLDEVLKQVENRMKEYERSGKRGGYDLPEDAVDPWKMFTTLGHEIPASIVKMKPQFFARKLKFGDGGYRPIRQMFDERVFEEKGRFVRIARDVYTAHYFDGWGEWFEVRCGLGGRELFIVQDMLMEFDLLKNTDFLSRLARPKMRQGVEQESLKIQKAQMERIFPGSGVSR